MLWFLRLFRRFRDIEAAVADKTVLEERLDGVQRNCDWLRSQLETAIKNERAAYQMHVNFECQMRYGMAPYPDAPRLPERFNASAETPDPLPPDFVQATRLVQKQEEDFLRKAREMAGL